MLHAQTVTELVSKEKSTGWIAPSVFIHLSDKSCLSIADSWSVCHSPDDVGPWITSLEPGSWVISPSSFSLEAIQRNGASSEGVAGLGVTGGNAGVVVLGRLDFDFNVHRKSKFPFEIDS